MDCVSWRTAGVEIFRSAWAFAGATSKSSAEAAAANSTFGTRGKVRVRGTAVSSGAVTEDRLSPSFASLPSPPHTSSMILSAAFSAAAAGK
jgi:hypothetical protein